MIQTILHAHLVPPCPGVNIIGRASGNRAPFDIARPTWWGSETAYPHDAVTVRINFRVLDRIT